MNDKTIIFFDGECRFCIGWVRFILDRDGADRFRFASLQSDWSKKFFKSEELPFPEKPSVVVYKSGVSHFASEAVAEIAAELPGIWNFAKYIRNLPFSVRNRGYHWIAARRYKLFGKRKTCWIPSADDKRKFLDL